jgi:hypothetical protein
MTVTATTAEADRARAWARTLDSIVNGKAKTAIVPFLAGVDIYFVYGFAGMR